jgi:uncharacterized protein YbaA (DUF1428 family)
MAYVDGYVLAVPRAKLDDYWKMAALGRDVWMEHGALTYSEAMADDVPYGEVTSFPRAVQATEDEVVIFSFITYRDRAHRDEVNAMVMADARMNSFDPKSAPFDMKRMIFGGFEQKITG